MREEYEEEMERV
ncbi:hypothetical protein CISIN_1g0251782mg, partial [Citrus sinensis]